MGTAWRSAVRRLKLSLRQQLLLVLASLLAGVWLSIAWGSHKSESDELAQIYERTSTLALAFSERTESTLQRVDYVLFRLREAWLSQPAAFGNAVAHQRGLLGDSTFQIAVIGADGYLAYSSLAPANGRTFLGDREHFTAHNATVVDQLFLSAPVKGRVSGKWSIQLTRPIIDAGRFAGVMVISVDPDYFVRLYKQTGHDSQTLVSIVNDRGTIMSRSIAQDAYIGQQVTGAPFMAPDAAQHGSFRRVSAIDGEERLFGYHRLPSYKVTVLVGAHLAQQLAPWQRHQRTVWLVATGMTLVLAGMGYLMWCGIARREAVEQSLLASEAFAKGTFDAASARICVLDKTGVVLAVNQAWRDFRRQRRALVPEQESDIGFNYLAVCDVTAGADSDVVAPMAQGIRRVTQAELVEFTMEYSCHSPTGKRWYMARVTRFRGDSGNLVVAHEDITERKQAKARLQLAASVFSHAREGIMITDSDSAIVDVNDTFTAITGYSRQDAVGQTPRLLQSGRQAPDYYVAMWKALNETGHWSGEVWNRRKSGELYAAMQTVSAVGDADGKTQNYVALFTDISVMKTYQQQLERTAHFDALTGLPNRVLLADRLQQAMLQSHRRRRSLAVVFIDLDGFKAVNDTHGHSAGDELLVGLAQHMKTALRDGDTLARIGGDEFVALLVDLEQAQDCEPVLRRLLRAAAEPVAMDDATIQVTASMGVTIYPQDSVDADSLMRHADQAMYRAKQAGRNRYCRFDLTHFTLSLGRSQ